MRRLILGIVVSVLAILFIPYIIVPAYAEPYITEVINELGFIVVEADNETFPGGCYEITLYAEFAAYRDENNLSYYELGTDTYTLIFAGPEGGNGYIEPPLTRTFVADSEFGLSMVTPEGHTYYTETNMMRQLRTVPKGTSGITCSGVQSFKNINTLSFLYITK